MCVCLGTHGDFLGGILTQKVEVIFEMILQLLSLHLTCKNLFIDVDEQNLIVSNFKILGISMYNVYL